MIFLPQIKPELLRGLEVDFGSSISASTWRKIVNNQTWVERALPIGSIFFFHEEISLSNGNPKEGVNTDIWVFCDGRTISDPDSPLNGIITPNLINLFPKGSQTIGDTGGNETINIEHDHGGQTGTTDDRGARISDTGGDHNTGAPHFHSIDTKWSTEEPIIPRFLAVQPYMRYK